MDAPTQGSNRYGQPDVLPVSRGLLSSPAFTPRVDQIPAPSDPTLQSQTRRRLVALLCIPILFSLLVAALAAFREYADVQLLHTQRLSSSLQQLRTLAIDLEDNERSYLLTGDQRFTKRFDSDQRALPSQIETCQQNAREQPPEVQSQVASLSATLRSRTASLDAVRTISRNEAISQIKAGDGEAANDQIRRSIANLQTALSLREMKLFERQRDLNHLAFLVFLLGISVLVFVLYRLYRSSVLYLRERDLASERLQQSNLSLEAQVEERTRDLRLANEELQQFAYVASHDLQEPLRTITSFSQLIESRYKNRLDADADEFIGYIVSSARRMTDLINGLLSLMRLRKSGQPVARVSFAEILSDAEAILLSAIGEANAQITSGFLPQLVVDRVQFLQVFQNLLSNAIKYRREEPLRIVVSARRDDSNWVFSIADNGRGFDPQFADRIFGLFQRLHGREAIEGTGLGLSIAKKIIERHGGRMWAESVENFGSTFYFSLPVSLEGVRQE